MNIVHGSKSSKYEQCIKCSHCNPWRLEYHLTLDLAGVKNVLELEQHLV